MIVKQSIRKLYGRCPNGRSNRRNIKLTMTPETVSMVESVTEFGKGKNGSAFIELSTRVLVALIESGEDVDQIAIELKNSIDSPYLIQNLNRLKKLMEA